MVERVSTNQFSISILFLKGMLTSITQQSQQRPLRHAASATSALLSKSGLGVLIVAAIEGTDKGSDQGP